ncbi:MAG: alkaline phosphatase [Bacteroidales bacterium]
METKPEVFIGGGYNNFARRIDSVDMVKQLVDEGYTIVTSVEELEIETDATMLAGLLAPEHLPAISEGRGDMLSYAAIKAIETLNKNDKVFLMIEASQIDWGAHENNTRGIL